MKNLPAPTLALMLFLTGSLMRAQSIERSVISSFGFAFSGPTVQNSCTVGEAITFADQNDSFILTQGFQQPAAEDDLCIGGSNVVINANACSSYQLNGEVYTSSGTYTQEMVTEEGCDSIITLNLTISELNNDITTNGDTLTAVQDNATYVWIDCMTQNVVGTEQSFIPMSNGMYQVQVSQEGCEALSDCVQVIIDGISESISAVTMNLYPNPTRDLVWLEISGSDRFTDVHIVDVAGRQVMQKVLVSSVTMLPLGNLAAGAYVVVVRAGDKLLYRSLIKE